MYKNYNINGQVVRVWVWGGDAHTEVTVHTTKGCYDREIQTDENGGKYFTWGSQKVYLSKYIAMPMVEMREKLTSGANIIPDEFCVSLEREGLDRVRFVCPMNPIDAVIGGLAVCNGNTTVPTICKVVETHHKVMDGYKIEVVPVDQYAPVAGRSYYIEDFVSLIKSGHISIMLEGEVLAEPEVEPDGIFVKLINFLAGERKPKEKKMATN